MSMYGKEYGPIKDFGPSLTKQSMRDECDINVIMKKYEKSGLIAHVNSFQGFYDDISNVPDLIGAFEIVRKAEEQFATLPGELRLKFDNDPVAYVSFVMDPRNRDELVKLGMIEVPAAAPVVAPVVDKPA